MSSELPRDTVVADRAEYENIVVETEFGNDCVITISKEPGEDRYFIYFGNLETTNPKNLGTHKMNHRLDCEDLIQTIKESIDILKNK
ncbi:MAG: hypothetical protein AAF607_10340 [Pseudomonadota bacterium]